MLQSHPPRQIPLVVVVVVPTDGQNIAQSVDFELVKVAVDGGIEEGFELYDTCGDFGLLEVVEEGGVSLFCRCCFGTGGGIGGRGRLGEVEAEGLRCGLLRPSSTLLMALKTMALTVLMMSSRSVWVVVVSAMGYCLSGCDDESVPKVYTGSAQSGAPYGSDYCPPSLRFECCCDYGDIVAGA